MVDMGKSSLNRSSPLDSYETKYRAEGPTDWGFVDDALHTPAKDGTLYHIICIDIHQNQART